MSTKYPAKIDDNVSLPPAIDGVTGVSCDIVNRLREAIIRIEDELGVKPRGMNTTVRNRLDSIEAVISNVEGTGSVVVIGSPTAGQVITWSGSAWIPQTETSDDVYRFITPLDLYDTYAWNTNVSSGDLDNSGNADNAIMENTSGPWVYGAVSQFGKTIQTIGGTASSFKLDGALTSLASATELTMQTWIRFGAVYTSGETSIFGMSQSDGTPNTHIGISWPTGKVIGGIRGSSYTQIDGYDSNVVTPNSWHHLAITWDGYATTLYFDGEVVGSAATTGTLDQGGTSPSWYIGDDPNNVGTSYFRGRVAMASVCPTLRDQSYIRESYARGFGVAEYASV